jgi:hypothetical protein
LADGTKGAGERPRDGFGSFLKFSFGIDEERSDRAGGVLFHRGEKSGEVGGGENGVVINNEEVSEGRKILKGVLASKGETATKTQIFS